MAMTCCASLLLMTAAIVTSTRETASPQAQPYDQVLLQTTSHRFQVSGNRHAAENAEPACCSASAGEAYYSPISEQCYDSKRKNYYAKCGGKAACCSACAGKAYCSTRSGRCYDWKKRGHYASCGGKPAAPRCCTDCAGKLGFFSPKSGSCYKSKSRDYYQACPAEDSNIQKGECKVGGDNWCAATVPDANFSLMTCPQLGMRIKAITYNLFWWNLFGQRKGNGGSAGKLVKHAAGDEPFDIACFQECDDPNWIMGDAAMSRDDYDYVRWGSNTMAFNKSRFEKLASGRDKFAQDFGKFSYRRGAHWARLQEKSTGNKLFVMNHHGPLPVNSGGICGGEATAYNILSVIQEHSEQGDALLFMGDFNADGNSKTVQTLKNYMHHVMNDWVDNMFSNCGRDAVRHKKNLGDGGSDHNALMTIIEY